MFGDVGQRLLGDAVECQTDRCRYPGLLAFGVQHDSQTGLDEIVDEIADVGDTGFRGNLGRTGVEQTNRAADIGHCLAAQSLGVGQRIDGVVDIAVPL
jgi:hypothetical protein